MSSIEISDVCKRFGETEVLRGVGLTVQDGSITAVLGPSGSGKTTLLRLIAGFETLDEGSIAIGERVVDDSRRALSAQHRGVGYVPQDGALFPHLTAAANVGFGLPRGERSQVAPLLELIGLGALGERYPHQLSGGQQQRVALARALAIEPRVVLLDEPFSSLDASLRTELRLDVARILRETATTTVLVTHDQDEALALADKVAVLGEGRVLACAEPRTLYHDPADAIAASSVGAANLIPAHVHGGRASCALGSVPLVGAAPEGAAQLLLRPEQLALAREPDGGAVAAEVVELDYHGHEALVRVRVAEQVLLARVSGELALVAQERVWVRAVGAGRAWPAPSM